MVVNQEGTNRELEGSLPEESNLERVNAIKQPRDGDSTSLEEFEVPWPNENEMELQVVPEPKETPPGKKSIDKTAAAEIDRIPRLPPIRRSGLGGTIDKTQVRPTRVVSSCRSIGGGSPRMSPASLPKRVMSFDAARMSSPTLHSRCNNSLRPNSRNSTPVRNRPTAPPIAPVAVTTAATQRDPAPSNHHHQLHNQHHHQHGEQHKNEHNQADTRKMRVVVPSSTPPAMQELSFTTPSAEDSHTSDDDEQPEQEFAGLSKMLDFDSLGMKILPRTLLPWSVFYNESLGKWVAAINTNPKALENNDISEASRALKALTAPREEQAKAFAMSYTPPKMLPFEDHPKCFTCDVKFTVFRRACHCRNCGVCICNSCSVHWPAKMIPTTYNTKNESRVSICKSCDALSHVFRLALLQGSYEQAIRVFGTKNINVITPFMQGKGEIMYPVHCAVVGGNLDLLRFLVDELHCPLTGSNGKRWRHDVNSEPTKLLTSKGRSLLRLAVEHNHVAICRYLIVEKRMLLAEEVDLSLANVVKTLDCVIRFLPESSLAALEAVNESFAADSKRNRNGIPELIEVPNPASDPDIQVGKECIICFSNEIDCVASPCGHHFCCLDCSMNLSSCPICMGHCTFLRVYWQV